jgi:superfamily II DNA or RNA helicase
MIVVLQNVYARVAHASPEEVAWLRQYLTYTPRESGRGGFFSGDKTVMHTRGRDHYFPAGLLDLVRDGAASPQPDEGRQAFTVDVQDARVRPCEPDWSADIGWLVEHQRAGVSKLVEKTRGTLAHATGAGKGEEMVALTRVLPCAWLMCAHRFNLCQDVAQRYEARTGRRAGLVGDGEWSLGDGNLVCATWQTLFKKLEARDPRAQHLVRQAQGLMGDESHTTAAETFGAVCSAASNAYWRVAMSGSPLDRTDRRSIYNVGHFGPIIHKVTQKDLVAIGFSAKLTVHVERVAHERVWTTDKYQTYVVDSDVRNQRVLAAVMRHERPAMVFVRRLDHADRVRRLVERAGLKAFVLVGRVPSKRRADVMAACTREGEAVLITNQVTQEGEVHKSIVEFRSMVNAGGMSSPIVVTQQAGRMVRRFDKSGREVKAEAHVTDFMDEVDGDPDATVAQHARDRVKAYMKAGHDVRLEG